MMDTIENRPLTEPATQEAGEVATVTEVTVTPVLSKEDVISRLQEICESESPIDKSELDNLKQSFYRLRNAEVEAARKAHAENGGNDENFITPKDDLETNFREIMNTIKEKRNALKAEEEREKQENLEKKLSIIDRIKELAESTEEANNAILLYSSTSAFVISLPPNHSANVFMSRIYFSIVTEHFSSSIK